MNMTDAHLTKLVEAIKAQRGARETLRAARRAQAEALRGLRGAGVSWTTIAMKLGRALNAPLSVSKRLALADALRKRTHRTERGEDEAHVAPTAGGSRPPVTEVDEHPTRRTTVTEEFSKATRRPR